MKPAFGRLMQHEAKNQKLLPDQMPKMFTITFGKILLVGHGKGKSDLMLKLVQHLERLHPETAAKVVAALDVNMPAMTEPQILAVAREWFDDHKNG
jgi:hypothetical protein